MHVHFITVKEVLETIFYKKGSVYSAVVDTLGFS